MVAIVLFVFTLVLFTTVGLYYLVQAKRDNRQPMDRRAAEQTARRDNHK